MKYTFDYVQVNILPKFFFEEKNMKSPDGQNIIKYPKLFLLTNIFDNFQFNLHFYSELHLLLHAICTVICPEKKYPRKILAEVEKY